VRLPELPPPRSTCQEWTAADGLAVIDAKPVEFDFERDDAPPDYLVSGVIERETVTVLSGDTAAGKSIIAAALTVAVLKGTEWLGRDVQAGRVVYVDEENTRRIIRDRLAALGLTNAERDGLAYYLRQGICLGSPEWNAWLASIAQQHRADLVVIDTASSATGSDVNDNSKVAQLYREAFRPATVNGAAVLLLHHERKLTGDHRNASQAMLGARQWAGQADGHLAVRPTGSLVSDPTEDGHSRQSYPIELETPKVRDGQPPLPEQFVIASERDATNRLVRMALERTEDHRLVKLVEALRDHGPMKRAALAGALGTDSQNGTFDDLLKASIGAGKVRKTGYGIYALA
jgi:hypothetical protein